MHLFSVGTEVYLNFLGQSFMITTKGLISFLLVQNMLFSGDLSLKNKVLNLGLN